MQLAKTTGYHKQYLSDEDLRNGYDAILKKIEQGTETWSFTLGEELHKYYDYRANVIMRSKLEDNSERIGTERHASPPKDKGKVPEDEKKPIFCMEYNKKKCEHDSSHEGNFAGNKCIKWHICRRCLRFNEIKHHAEDDACCSRKARLGTTQEEQWEEEVDCHSSNFDIRNFLDCDSMTQEEIDRCEFWVTAYRWVSLSDCHNFQQEKILVNHKWNFEYLERELAIIKISKLSIS